MHIVTDIMKAGPTVINLRKLVHGGDIEIVKVFISEKAVEELFGGNSPKQIAGIPVDIDPALATQQARILLGEKSEPGRQT